MNRFRFNFKYYCALVLSPLAIYMCIVVHALLMAWIPSNRSQGCLFQAFGVNVFQRIRCSAIMEYVGNWIYLYYISSFCLCISQFAWNWESEEGCSPIGLQPNHAYRHQLNMVGHIKRTKGNHMYGDRFFSFLFLFFLKPLPFGYIINQVI